MEQKKWMQSTVLKTVSILTIPIATIFMIISILVMIYTVQYPDVTTNKSYFETDFFIDQYKSKLQECTTTVKSVKNTLIERYGEYSDGTPTQQFAITEAEKIYYRMNYYTKGDSNFRYLVINPDTNEAYTNVSMNGKNDSIEGIKQQITQMQYYWNYVNGVVNTNISSLSGEQLKYSNMMNLFRQNGNEVYTSIDSSLAENDFFVTSAKIYQFVQKYYSYEYWVGILSFVIFMIDLIYLIYSTGHVKGKEKIALNWFDRLPLEVFGLVAILVASIFLALAIESGGMMQYNVIFFAPCMICSYLCLLFSFYCMGSVLKRVKSKTFWKNSFVYKLYHWTKQKLIKIYRSVMYNINTAFRLALVFSGMVLVSIILFALIRAWGAFAILLLLGFWVYCYWFMLQRMNEFNKIKEVTKQIYEGHTDIRLQEEQLKGVLKEMAVYLKDIAGGFSNAIEESLKSERLKTELITNVSHDIKTPLTSIINYVDLLKREEIQDEKIKEYIDVLDSKSQRLKKLIEDLVEASKASSGNLKLEKEKLNVCELIKQVTGEFEDRLKDKQLKVILSFPKEETTIIADNRYLYRVIENLYSNVTKYALEGSRVYVDVVKNQEKIVIAIKNISKEELNISVDELMQRFVRGDKARNTEGSGLGLSIAQSLTQLQGGNFDIYLDGDLFKVVLEF